jgi:hypothetical protein
MTILNYGVIDGDKKNDDKAFAMPGRIATQFQFKPIPKVLTIHLNKVRHCYENN